MHGYHAHPSDFVTKGSKISQESAVAGASSTPTGTVANTYLVAPFTNSAGVWSPCVRLISTYTGGSAYLADLTFAGFPIGRVRRILHHLASLIDPKFPDRTKLHALDAASRHGYSSRTIQEGERP